METLEKVMEHYSEALNELMDAQKYQKLAERAEGEDKSMYKMLAKQELEHEAMIEKSAERLRKGEDEMLHKVWQHLRQHLHDWKRDIERRLED